MLPFGEINELVKDVFSRTFSEGTIWISEKEFSKKLIPVFGNITGNKNMNYFTLRTKKKVNIQWNLYSIVHNIEKIKNNRG